MRRLREADTVMSPTRPRSFAAHRRGASRFGYLVVALVAVAVVFLLTPRAAHAACTCQATKPERGMTDSAAVFLGTLTEISPPENGIVTLAFDVRLVYKGDVAATILLQTFASVEDCGIGKNAQRGDWLVFAYAIPGGTGPPLLSTCSPSMLLTSTTRLPVEIGQGKAPPGAAAYVPANAGPVGATFYGTVTDPRDTRNKILVVVGLVVVIGLAARLLAGRRRFVVR